MRAPILALLAFAALAGTGAARATPSYDGCTALLTQKNTGPHYLMQPGTYCVTEDLTFVPTPEEADVLVWIHANDVVLDCKGHRLISTTPIGATTADAVAAMSARSTIRNCDIRGFFSGISGADRPLEVQGLLVEDNVLHDNRRAISVDTRNSVVRRNRISGASLGIKIGRSSVVADNVISDIRTGPGESAWAIYSYIGDGTVITGNRIRDVRDDLGNGASVIELQGYADPDRVSIRDNVIVAAPDGGNVPTAIDCNFTLAIVSGNIIGGFPTAMTGCTDAGGNDLGP